MRMVDTDALLDGVGNFVKATYDGIPCLLNMDYVMDMFSEHGIYKAYTMDFDRGEYLITKSELIKWQSKVEGSKEDEQIH